MGKYYTLIFLRVLRAYAAGSLIGLLAFRALFLLMLPHSYVLFGPLQTYSQEQIKVALLKFNSYANYDVFKFDKNWRKITIDEDDNALNNIPLSEKGNEVIGEAEPQVFKCKSHLRSGMSQATLEQVLWHEMAHCFGYEHVNNPDDMMNPVYYGFVPQENYKKWAGVIRDRLKFWYGRFR